ncbi:MAG: hypothetical protein Ct9H300mP14_06320 [Gammaproteobacteria bacterium]|nr:MAG: hypothetical protein Ct9H300mP14_06320 [Gammaproteobacteria bacterium]
MKTVLLSPRSGRSLRPGYPPMSSGFGSGVGFKKDLSAAAEKDNLWWACRRGRGHSGPAMVCLMAMQGLGKPGVILAISDWSTLNHHFYFPGYAEGGISVISRVRTAFNLFQRQPHVMSMNSVSQKVPRAYIAESITEDRVEGFPTDPRPWASVSEIRLSSSGSLAGSYDVQIRWGPFQT